MNVLKLRKDEDKAIERELRTGERYHIVPALSGDSYDDTKRAETDGKKYALTLCDNTYIVDTVDYGRFKKAPAREILIAYKDDEAKGRYIALLKMKDGTTRALVLFKNNIDTITVLC